MIIGWYLEKYDYCKLSPVQMNTYSLAIVHPEIVDFSSERGRSIFAAAPFRRDLRHA